MMQYILPIGIGAGIGASLFISFIILRKLSKSNKTRILFFDTDKTCKIKDHDMKEGRIKIGKKIWDITKENTYMLKDKGKIFPFLILKHDSSKAIDVVAKGGTKGVKPDEMASLINMSVLKMLIEPMGVMSGKFAIGFSIIMLVLGIAVGVVLVSTGIITV